MNRKRSGKRNVPLWGQILIGAEVARGGKGAARLDARSLASLYSGFLRASDLARAGRVTGDPASIAALDALFAVPPPGLPDFF